MNCNPSEIDPLSSYSYTYPNHDSNMVYLPPYSYNAKPECPPNSHYNTILNPMPYVNPIVPDDVQTNIQTNDIPSENVQENPTVQSEPNAEEIDTKEHIKLLPDLPKRKKGKGRTSNYWNKKIQDANFPFYGCTICNISFQKIQDLDQHITIHKGRLTSYGIRLRNKSRKKQLKKEQKPLRKLKKKKIKNELPIEIKPEDGYIGNEKATEFVQNDENIVNNHNNDGDTKATDKDSEKVQNSQNKLPNEHNEPLVNNEPSKQNNEPTEDTRLQKLFKCFACQKQFSLSYYLKLHVRSHTGMLFNYLV